MICNISLQSIYLLFILDILWSLLFHFSPGSQMLSYVSNDISFGHVGTLAGFINFDTLLTLASVFVESSPLPAKGAIGLFLVLEAKFDYGY